MAQFETPPVPTCIIIGDRLVITDGKYRYRDANGVHMVATQEGWDELASIITNEGGFQKFGNRELGLKNWKIYAPSRQALIEKFREINATVPLVRFGKPNPGVTYVVWREGVCEGHVMITLPEPIKLPLLGKAVGRDRSTVTNANFTARKPFKLSGVGGTDLSVSTGQGEAGEVTFTNEGNAPEQPVILEVTDTVSPVLTLSSSNPVQVMSFPDLTVPSGSSLLIDFEKMSVTLDGVNAYSELSGNFFTFDQATNTVGLTGAIGPNGKLTAHFNHANL